MIRNTTIKDYGEGCYMTDIIVMQQQLENLGFIEKLIILEEQNYRIINKEKLINNWLRKMM